VSAQPWRSAALLGLSLLLAFQIPHALRRGRPGWAFIASSATIVLHLALAGVTAYPVLVFSTPNHEFDMTITNSAATPATLRFMLAVAVIGLPLVLSYTITVYTVFRRKVVLDEESY
jgi:cytochrome d ubiquinol oxidase subunit II